MITLHDILTDLTYGEFAHLNLGRFRPEEQESEPDPKSYAQLSSWVNLGLKAIYSKFWLAKEELTLTLDSTIDTYVLSFDYAASNGASSQPVKYITDTGADPFPDNVLKIEEVWDDDATVTSLMQLFLNDTSEDLSLFTPSYRSLKIILPTEYTTLTVKYRAAHEKIVYAADMDPADIEIVIPHPLHEALLWYIASRGFASLGGDQGAEGNDYYRKYEARVQSVKDWGFEISNETQNWRFRDNGWA